MPADNQRIQAVIFDLGNVLIDFDHTTAAKKIANFCDKTPQEIFNLFFDSQLTALFEEGKISPLDFFSEVKTMLKLKLDYQGFLPVWNEIFFLTEKNHAVYHLAKSLKAKYKIALLSNVNILHFDYVKEKFPIWDAFHHIITSYEIGFRKPHPQIYQHTLDALKTPAQNTFYTDDRADLIEQASLLGINSFTFQGVSGLKQALRRCGVAIN